MLFLCLTPAYPENEHIITLTRAVSASGQPGMLYLHAIAFPSGEIIGAPIPIPGNTPGPITGLGPAGRFIVASRIEGAPGGLVPAPVHGFASIIGLAPFGPVAPDGVRILSGQSVLLNAGSMSLLECRADGVSVHIPGAGPGEVFPLPGVHTAACPAMDDGVATLSMGPEPGAMRLHLLGATGHPSPGGIPLDTLTSGRLAQSHPVAVQSIPATSVVCALASGFLAGGEGSGGGASLAQAISLSTRTPLGEPVLLQGTATGLYPGVSNEIWALTTDTPNSAAYLTRLQLGETGLAIVASYPILGVSAPPPVAVHPVTGDVAVAINGRLEIWSAGAPGSLALDFPTPVGCLAWSARMLYAGESGDLHAIDPTAAGVMKSIRLNLGRAVLIMPLPDGAILVANANPSPSLPPVFVLPRNAPPGTRKGFRLSAVNGASWWLRIGESAALANSREGIMELPLAAFRAYDPNFAGVAAWLWTDDGQPGTIRPAAPVSLLWNRLNDGLRRIVWVMEETLGGAEPRRSSQTGGLKVFADLAASQPLNLGSSPAGATRAEALALSQVLVVSATQASQGLIAPRQTLDFVAKGGALLFLGRFLSEPGSRGLPDWLAPAGIYLDTGVSFDGQPEGPLEGLARGLEDTSFAEGCQMSALESRLFSARVPAGPAPGQVVFVARDYGLGRLAVLASPTPLLDESLKQPGPRRFATQLLRWLTRAGTDVRDFDGDELPDSLEDVNSDGAWSFNETDFADLDTDMDGLPDGLEDLDRDGEPGLNETNPLDPDSDGDGVMDGADTSPVPQPTAPRVFRVIPASGGVEGGAAVRIFGRNLVEGMEVRFGGAPSPSVSLLEPGTLLALTPAWSAPEGGRVTVNIQRDGASAGLTNGFEYLPAISLMLILTETTMPDGAVGIQLNLQSPRDMSLRELGVSLAFGPDGAGRFGAPLPPESAVEQLDAGRLTLEWRDITAGQDETAIVRIPYERIKEKSVVGVFVNGARAMGPLGEPIAIASYPLTFSP